MTALSIALLQINPCVGDLEANAASILRHAQVAAGEGAELILFPELCLSGYPPEDLVLKAHFLEACEQALAELALRLPSGSLVILGAPCKGVKKATNTAIGFLGGKEVFRYHKQRLPNYGVFDEKRIFEPGQNPGVFRFGTFNIGLHICEDSWDTSATSFDNLKDRPLDLLLNLSASPFHWGKHKQRRAILQQAAKQVDASLAYCNLVGGQDELVFDGRSLVLNSDGELLAQAAAHTETALYLEFMTETETEKDWSSAWGPTLNHLNKDVSLPPPAFANELDPLEDVYQALMVGVRDYVNKNGFEKVLIAVSGGVDSALVLALAVDALGADRVVGVTMPSRYNSPETISDSGRICEAFGVEMHTVPIKNLFNDYLEELSSLWEGRDVDVTEENLQARIRGNIIMALSNKFGWMVLTTGNKSELATGYCTLYGDMAGGYAVIKDVPKTVVFDLCRHRNRDGEMIPTSIIDRPPSAELRDDQKDSDSLPPYDVLDAILKAYVEEDQGMENIVAKGFEEDVVRRVIRLVDINEYKRRQGAPGVKITPKAFGRDRRVPITNAYRNQGFKGINL